MVVICIPEGMHKKLTQYLSACSFCQWGIYLNHFIYVFHFHPNSQRNLTENWTPVRNTQGGGEIYQIRWKIELLGECDHFSYLAKHTKEAEGKAEEASRSRAQIVQEPKQDFNAGVLCLSWTLFHKTLTYPSFKEVQFDLWFKWSF